VAKDFNLLIECPS